MKKILKLTLVIFVAAGIFSSCKKDDSRPNPTMTFVTDQGYTSQDATLNAGDTVRIGLNCNWNGTDLITTLKQYYNDDLVQTTPFTPFESGIITSTITKTGADTEKYTFEIVDANGQKTSLSLTLTKASSGGAIDILTGIAVGAQGNTTIGSYYSLSNNIVYNSADAFGNQGAIDILGVYDADNASYLASPGASFKDGQYDLSTWTTKNTTYYCKMDITADQYGYIDGDQYIIDSYNGFIEDDRKRKAKDLKKDDIYVFKTESGKYGILKVNSVTTAETGSISFDIKIQQ